MWKLIKDMNKIIPTTAFVLTALSLSLAQNSAIKAGLSVFHHNDYEKSITGFGGGAILEYKIGKKLSIATSLDYVGGESIATATLVTGDLINLSYKAPTIGFRPEIRYYSKEVMIGFFAGIGFNLTSSKVGEIVNGSNPAEPYIVKKSDDISAYPTLLLGLNLPIRSNLCVEFSGGLGVLIEDTAYFSVPIGMRIGYMF